MELRHIRYFWLPPRSGISRGRRPRLASAGPRRGAYRGRQGVLGRREGDTVDGREGDDGAPARVEMGSLGVGFTASGTFNVVAPSTIRAFRRAYPDIDLTLEEANTAPLITRLR